VEKSTAGSSSAGKPEQRNQKHFERQKRLSEHSTKSIISPTTPEGPVIQPKLAENVQTCTSPESPLSKMELMTPPPSSDNSEGLLTPKNLSQLEIPTPERLIRLYPELQGGKEGITALADKVREALAIPSIPPKKYDSVDKADVRNYFYLNRQSLNLFVF
jgi:hypothetical protein